MTWRPCEHPSRFGVDDPLLWLDMELADLAGSYTAGNATPGDDIRLEMVDLFQQMIELGHTKWKP